MKFKEPLLQGTLIKRYKRFFADIKYKNNTLIAHCPNTGSMHGLLIKGNKVFFSKSDDPKRKLKYTLEIIEDKNSLVGINTLFTNKIVLDALKNKKIKEFTKFTETKSEVKFNKQTRFDFLVSNNSEKCFLEVKNVTLKRNKNLAEFPDAPTSRGLKHLNELCVAKEKGYKSYILFLIQRTDCDSFTIAHDIDKEYSSAFKKAIKKGVKMISYDCKLNYEEIKLNKQIKIIE
jgi:sugar fermentation stimulation protein A